MLIQTRRFTCLFILVPPGDVDGAQGVDDSPPVEKESCGLANWGVPTSKGPRCGGRRVRAPANIGQRCGGRREDIRETENENVDDGPPPEGNDEPPAAPTPPLRCCREAYDYVLRPLSGKIAGSSLAFSVSFFVAATVVENAKPVAIRACFGLAGLCLLVAVVSAVLFGKEKIYEGRKRRDRGGAESTDGRQDVSSSIP